MTERKLGSSSKDLWIWGLLVLFSAAPGLGSTVVFKDDFETDKGWSASPASNAGEWERGTPKGLGSFRGHQDPTSAYSGTNVLGNDLSGTGAHPGDYEPSVGGSSIVSPAIDCTGRSGLWLSFMRYLAVEEPVFDQATVYVSSDGSAWTRVWQNLGEFGDTGWRRCLYDISAVADNQATVYIRFEILSDATANFPGFTLDDVEILVPDNVVYSDGFESPSGWTLDASHEWEIGAPQGKGGGNYGSPDPSLAYAGTNVLGVDLGISGNGEYEPAMVDGYAISPTYDLSNATDVRLAFQRWLGVEDSRFDHARVYVQNDGSTWNEVWGNPQDTSISMWKPVILDISAVADNQSTVYVRFGIASDATNRYAGWTIDDLEVLSDSSIFFDDFESDTGWTLGSAGEWERNAPAGKGGSSGEPDPATTISGTNVLGTDLSGDGDYENSVSASYAVSPVIDCSGKTNVFLSFWRWLCVEDPSHDQASVWVSNDGSSWTKVYENQTEELDPAWSREIYDISEYADRQAAVKVKFRMDSDGSVQYSGFNIDEFQIIAQNCVSNPTVDVQPDGPLTICEGTPQTLTATTSGGSGTFTYQWTEDRIDIPGATSSQYSANTTGTHVYGCRVKSSLCAGEVSDPNLTSITWQPEPDFQGLSSVSNQGNAACQLDLAWNAATTVCGGPITYRIYRDIVTPVTVDAAHLIDFDVSGTTYPDVKGLVYGTTYYYVVHAFDQTSQREDSNTVEASGAPTGSGVDFLSENFAGGIPGTWTVIDGGTTGKTWFADNASDPQGCGNTDPNPPMGSGWAAVDSDCAVGASMDEQLVTPVVDLTGTTQVTLTFDHWFRFHSSEVADVDLKSSKTGGTFTNVYTISGVSSPNPESKTIDITSLAAGVSDLQVRFRYHQALNDWYWYVDNVKVTGYGTNTCTTGRAPEVSDDAGHLLQATKNGGNVDITFEDVGGFNYNVYVSNSKTTSPFKVLNSADGHLTCAVGGVTSVGSGMNQVANFDLTSGITGSMSTLYFLVTADYDLAATEGILGGSRMADSDCNK